MLSNLVDINSIEVKQSSDDIWYSYMIVEEV